MPQFIYAAVQYIATALINAGMYKTLAYGIAQLVVQLAVTAAIGAATRALQPKPKAMDQGTELRTKLDPALPREVMVGTASTGGSIAFLNSEGANNINLWQVIALSDAEIEEITKIRGNGEDLTFAGDFHAGYQNCTSHFKTAGGTPCLSMRVYKGTQSQTADAAILAAFPAMLDSNFRGRGIAYVITKMVWDQDAWAGGSEYVFIGKGAKCLDPRTGLSVWTENLALIANQFLRGFANNGIRIIGLGASSADLPDAEMSDAADDCDDDIPLAAGGTEKRYRGGGMISARETPREVLVHLMAGMAGRHVDRGGEIVILPGVARTPVFTAAQTTEDEMLADEAIAFAARRTSDERVNAIASTFVDPADGYQEGPTPPRKDDAAILADGGRFDASRAYRYVQSKTQAQRLDQIELRRARAEKWVAFSAPLWGFEMTPGDWFEAVSPRWRNETVTFEVETVGLTITSGAAGGEALARSAFAARETSAYVFEWSTADEITVAAAALTVGTPAPSRFSADDRLNGANASGNANLTGATVTRTPSSVLTASDVGATATVAVAAHDLKTSDPNGASLTVSYNSGSVTGLGFSTGYYIWASDANFAGGAVTYVAATASNTYLTDNRYIYVGYVTTPADGGAPESPPPPDPADCVWDEAWLGETMAGAICAGADIEVLDDEGKGPARAIVEGARSKMAPGVRLTSTSGIRLSCSTSTPITQPCGGVVRALDALGAHVAVRDAAGFRWERIAQVDRIGPIRVRRIHVGGRTYAAGDEEGRFMFTHNSIKP